MPLADPRRRRSSTNRRDHGLARRHRRRHLRMGLLPLVREKGKGKEEIRGEERKEQPDWSWGREEGGRDGQYRCPRQLSSRATPLEATHSDDELILTVLRLMIRTGDEQESHLKLLNLKIPRALCSSDVFTPTGLSPVQSVHRPACHIVFLHFVPVSPPCRICCTIFNDCHDPCSRSGLSLRSSPRERRTKRAPRLSDRRPTHYSQLALRALFLLRPSQQI